MKINDQLSVHIIPVGKIQTWHGRFVARYRPEFMLGKYVLPEFWNNRAICSSSKPPDLTEARSTNNAIFNCLVKFPNDLDWLQNEY